MENLLTDPKKGGKSPEQYPKTKVNKKTQDQVKCIDVKGGTFYC